LPDTAAPSSEPSIGGRETILLVEDEDAVRRLAERVLSNAGYRVLAVGGAADALATMDSHDGPVHLLLTDVVMPHVNGPALARTIAARSPATRILFMSGYTDEEIVRHGVPAGLTRFLEKPFTVFDLTLAVRAALSD
jgi:DNA-binding NtrC family response regulator